MTFRFAHIAALAAVMIVFAGVSAHAQNIDPNQQEQPAPYDDQLVRLAEVLGAVHYLRNLCGAEENQTWRDQMQKLLEAENPSTARRARFVDGFNRGYRGYQRTHATCTDASRLLADRFVSEGVQISSQIATRYAN
ncbi:MAG: TIGR02301 family protein [Rhodobiaceae bacterium]|nr:TIGR02301 family protein [Rhodobiaceae bacterium]MCC0051243.1 TIGR02301 family protein [Rhodobiaceae bacterium]MCC0059908.1 TIGR02301 family protein [Rhodobiaceae bacterium]